MFKFSPQAHLQKPSSQRRVQFADLADAIIVHTEYQYTLDDIRLVWQARFQEVMVPWCNEKGIPLSKLPEIIIPDYEISYNVSDENTHGNLTHFLKQYVLKDEKNEQKNKFVYIPVNTGGHWVTLCLHVVGKRIAAAVYIDSLREGQLCANMLKAIKGQDTPIPSDENTLHREMNEATEGLTANFKNTLPETSHLVKLVRAADPDFKHPVHQRWHYLQPDAIVCGAFSVEASFECFKLICIGPDNYIIKPKWCDGDRTSEIRARHVRAVGVDSPFDKRQRDNQQRVQDQTFQVIRMQAMTELNKDWQVVLKMIQTLDAPYQNILKKALAPGLSEEHSNHLQRIREAIIQIKDDLSDKMESNIEQITLFSEILQLITNNQTNFEMIQYYEQATKWDFEIKLKGEFEQLMKVGRVLRGEEPASEKHAWFSWSGGANLFGGRSSNNSSNSVPASNNRGASASATADIPEDDEFIFD